MFSNAYTTVNVSLYLQGNISLYLQETGINQINLMPHNYALHWGQKIEDLGKIINSTVTTRFYTATEIIKTISITCLPYHHTE